LRRAIRIRVTRVEQLADEQPMRPSRRLVASCPPPLSLRRLVAAERGSFLVEAMIGALIMLIVGFGVLQMLDRSTALGGEQRRQAGAGNVAQIEQERIRALSLAEQSNLRRTKSYPVNGITFTSVSRTDWINDSAGDAGCTASASSADYLKLKTVVTWPLMGRRKPIELESIITPAVRSFGANQGSLAVQVNDRLGAGVSGLQLGLSGPATLSEPTSASGCVLWGYLTAGSGYALGFSRPPDWVTPDGQQVVSKPVTVVGDQTSNVALLYDRGGTIQTAFTTKRGPDDDEIPTSPGFAHVTHPGGGGVSRSFAVTGSQLTTGLLFPFTTPYTIHADTCTAAEVPVPAPTPTPQTPAAPLPVSATASPGTTTASDTMRLPAINLKVTARGTPVDGATIRVRTPCGTVIPRTTTRDGFIDDPGFPYAASLAICVSNGVRQREVTQSNTNFNVDSLTVDIRSDDPAGTCA
jgi:Tfp pilus assembly protein PilV